MAVLEYYSKPQTNLLHFARTAKPITEGFNISEKGKLTPSYSIDWQDKANEYTVPHPDGQYSLYLDCYHKIPVVKTAIDNTANFAIQSGYQLEGANHKVDEARRFVDKHDFDLSLLNIMKQMQLWGNAYLELEGMKLLPVDQMFVVVSRGGNNDGEIIGYKQKTDFQQEPITFNKNEIVHFKWNELGTAFYGSSDLKASLGTLRRLLQFQFDIGEVIHRYAQPIIHWKLGTIESPASATQISTFKSMLDDRDAGQDIITSTGVEAVPVTANMRMIQPDGLIEHLENQLIAGLQVPEIFIRGGKTSNKACYSEDTETLTEDGWKKYWEIDPEKDKIATFNPESNKIEYHRPLDGKLYLYDHKGKMVHFKNLQTDILVTPNHTMLTKYYDEPKKNVFYEWRKERADSIRQKRFLFRCAGDWDGQKTDSFLLPGVRSSTFCGNSGEDKTIPMNDWSEFLGYFVSEGGLSSTTPAFTIAQKDNVNWNRMIDNIGKMGFHIHSYNTDGYNRATVSSRQLWAWLTENVGTSCYEKKIPRQFLNMDKNNLQILFEALMVGDGSWDRNGTTSGYYSTTSPQLADDFQEICLKLGFRSHLHKNIDKRGGKRSPLYRISFCVKDTTQLSSEEIKEIDYEGKVYCFNVPNHFFITRRNGCVTIQGNTADVELQAFDRRVKALRMSVAKIVEDYIPAFKGVKIEWNEMSIETEATKSEMLSNLVGLRGAGLPADLALKMVGWGAWVNELKASDYKPPQQMPTGQLPFGQEPKPKQIPIPKKEPKEEDYYNQADYYEALEMWSRNHLNR